MKIKTVSTSTLELTPADCCAVAQGLGVYLVRLTEEIHNRTRLAEIFGGPGTSNFEHVQRIHEAAWDVASTDFGDTLSPLAVSPSKIAELEKEALRKKGKA
jgi:hypothetical protein